MKVKVQTGNPVKSFQHVRVESGGSLLAVQLSETLEMWETSTWERLWSAPSFSHLMEILFTAFGALGEFGLVLESMYDHVQLLGGELQGKWEHSWCKS